MHAKELSLREKKYARTKVGLMNVFMKHLRSSCFEDVSIKEVCREAEVAETTFFNYFPEKIDVIGYYIQLLTQKVITQAVKETSKGKVIPLINKIFSLLSVELSNTNMLYQIISVLLVQSEKPKKFFISPLEMQLAFQCSDSNYVEKNPAIDIDDFLNKALIGAVESGELPAKIKLEDVVISLMSILTGTLAAVKFKDLTSLGYHYKHQLKALWNSVGAKGVRE